MLIIADHRIPEQAKKNLARFGMVLWLEPQPGAYPAISAHPDIFFCPVGEQLIVAPNLIETVKKKLEETGVKYVPGNDPVGKKYPETARYNAVATDDFLIGNTDYTDKSILQASGNRKIIRVNQGYTRCNLIPLANHRFITSDRGIEKELVQQGLEVLFVNPEGILLPGFKHGFIGGACGVWQDKLLINGNLDHFPEGQKIREFVKNMVIIELYDGPLFDGGSLMFIQKPLNI